MSDDPKKHDEGENLNDGSNAVNKGVGADTDHGTTKKPPPIKFSYGTARHQSVHDIFYRGVQVSKGSSGASSTKSGVNAQDHGETSDHKADSGSKVDSSVVLQTESFSHSSSNENEQKKISASDSDVLQSNEGVEAHAVSDNTGSKRLPETKELETPSKTEIDFEVDTSHTKQKVLQSCLGFRDDNQDLSVEDEETLAQLCLLEQLRLIDEAAKLNDTLCGDYRSISLLELRIAACDRARGALASRARELVDEFADLSVTHSKAVSKLVELLMDRESRVATMCSAADSLNELREKTQLLRQHYHSTLTRYKALQNAQNLPSAFIPKKIEEVRRNYESSTANLTNWVREECSRNSAIDQLQKKITSLEEQLKRINSLMHSQLTIELSDGDEKTDLEVKEQQSADSLLFASPNKIEEEKVLEVSSKNLAVEALAETLREVEIQSRESSGKNAATEAAAAAFVSKTFPEEGEIISKDLPPEVLQAVNLTIIPDDENTEESLEITANDAVMIFQRNSESQQENNDRLSDSAELTASVKKAFEEEKRLDSPIQQNMQENVCEGEDASSDKDPIKLEKMRNRTLTELEQCKSNLLLAKTEHEKTVARVRQEQNKVNTNLITFQALDFFQKSRNVAEKRLNELKNKLLPEMKARLGSCIDMLEQLSATIAEGFSQYQLLMRCTFKLELLVEVLKQRISRTELEYDEVLYLGAHTDRVKQELVEWYTNELFVTEKRSQKVRRVHQQVALYTAGLNYLMMKSFDDPNPVLNAKKNLMEDNGLLSTRTVLSPLVRNVAERFPQSLPDEKATPKDANSPDLQHGGNKARLAYKAAEAEAVSLAYSAAHTHEQSTKMKENAMIARAQAEEMLKKIQDEENVDDFEEVDHGLMEKQRLALIAKASELESKAEELQLTSDEASIKAAQASLRASSLRAAAEAEAAKEAGVESLVRDSFESPTHEEGVQDGNIPLEEAIFGIYMEHSRQIRDKFNRALKEEALAKSGGNSKAKNPSKGKRLDLLSKSPAHLIDDFGLGALEVEMKHSKTFRRFISSLFKTSRSNLNMLLAGIEQIERDLSDPEIEKYQTADESAVQAETRRVFETSRDWLRADPLRTFLPPPPEPSSLKPCIATVHCLFKGVRLSGLCSVNSMLFHFESHAFFTPIAKPFQPLNLPALSEAGQTPLNSPSSNSRDSGMQDGEPTLERMSFPDFTYKIGFDTKFIIGVEWIELEDHIRPSGATDHSIPVISENGASKGATNGPPSGSSGGYIKIIKDLPEAEVDFSKEVTINASSANSSLMDAELSPESTSLPHLFPTQVKQGVEEAVAVHSQLTSQSFTHGHGIVQRSRKALLYLHVSPDFEDHYKFGIPDTNPMEYMAKTESTRVEDNGPTMSSSRPVGSVIRSLEKDICESRNSALEPYDVIKTTDVHSKTLKDLETLCYKLDVNASCARRDSETLIEVVECEDSMLKNVSAMGRSDFSPEAAAGALSQIEKMGKGLFQSEEFSECTNRHSPENTENEHSEIDSLVAKDPHSKADSTSKPSTEKSEPVLLCFFGDSSNIMYLYHAISKAITHRYMSAVTEYDYENYVSLVGSIMRTTIQARKTKRKVSDATSDDKAQDVESQEEYSVSDLSLPTVPQPLPDPYAHWAKQPIPLSAIAACTLEMLDAFAFAAFLDEQIENLETGLPSSPNALPNLAEEPQITTRSNQKIFFPSVLPTPSTVAIAYAHQDTRVLSGLPESVRKLLLNANKKAELKSALSEENENHFVQGGSFFIHYLMANRQDGSDHLSDTTSEGKKSASSKRSAKERNDASGGKSQKKWRLPWRKKSTAETPSNDSDSILSAKASLQQEDEWHHVSRDSVEDGNENEDVDQDASDSGEDADGDETDKGFMEEDMKKKVGAGALRVYDSNHLVDTHRATKEHDSAVSYAFHAPLNPTAQRINVVGTSSILTVNQLKELISNVPRTHHLYPWSLMFSMSRHGAQISRLYNNAIRAPNVTILLVRDSYGSAFGAYIPTKWNNAPGPFGSGAGFVFAYHSPEACKLAAEAKRKRELELSGVKDPEDSSSKKDGEDVDAHAGTSLKTLPGPLAIYRWIESKRSKDLAFIERRDFGLAFGSGGGGHAFFLDSALSSGTSARSATYMNRVLSSESPFRPYEVELWGRSI